MTFIRWTQIFVAKTGLEPASPCLLCRPLTKPISVLRVIFSEPPVGIEPTSADYETAIIAFILRGHCGGNRSRTDIWWVKATHTQPLYDTAVDTCGIRTPPSQCKCEVLPSYTTRPIFVELTDSNRLLSGLSSLFHPVSIRTQLALSPIFGGRGETRTHLPRRPIRRFVDAGWFYRPVPLLSHYMYS